MVAGQRISVYNKDKLDELITELAQSREDGIMEFKIAKVFEKFYDEAESKGMEQGLQQGKVQGIEIGMEQVASKMLDKGLDVDTIIEVTGLSKARIERLKK